MTRRTRNGVVAAAVVVVLLVAGVAVWWLAGGRTKQHPTATSTSTPATSGGSGKKPGVLFGVSAGSTDRTQAGRIQALSDLQQSLGVNVGIVHVYRTLYQPIGTVSDRQFIADGKTLLISWAGTDTLEMSRGTIDSIIAQRAREVAALKVPVFFEYRWEMDRPNLTSVVHSAKDYISAWNRVRSVFRAQKVTNAQFVWCPLANGFATGRSQAYYPGDGEVDWICADLYPPVNQAEQSFATLSAPFLKWADGHDKPIMFGEFGVPRTWGTAKRSAWISGIAPVVSSHPRIKALAYYNSNAGAAPYSLSGDSQALDALAAVAKKFGAKPI